MEIYKPGLHILTELEKCDFSKITNAKKWIFVFILTIVSIAFIEKGLGDGFIWKEHSKLFSFFQKLPVLVDSPLVILIVPLLALPQITNYILDGFIWKLNKDNFKRK